MTALQQLRAFCKLAPSYVGARVICNVKSADSPFDAIGCGHYVYLASKPNLLTYSYVTYTAGVSCGPLSNCNDATNVLFTAKWKGFGKTDLEAAEKLLSELQNHWKYVVFRYSDDPKRLPHKCYAIKMFQSEDELRMRLALEGKDMR